jgi:3-phosphoshikimate 1-carboxyvinyltransferase
MDYLITPPASGIRTTIELPASKSISNRALILNALSDKKRGNSPDTISNLSDCDDTAVMLQALHSGTTDINIGAAGTAMRFLTAYLSGQPGTWTLTGTSRMKERPIGILVEALKSLGADIEYLEHKGFPPLRIVGHELKGGEVHLRGDISSQYISALLMIGPTMKVGLRLILTSELISQPYINLTIQLMRDFGVEVIKTDAGYDIAPQRYELKPFTVESDWSGASYWYEIAALSCGSKIELLGLHSNSYQGDAGLVKHFNNLGVRTDFNSSGVILTNTSQIAVKSLTLNLVDMPDIAQTLVATCIGLDIPFHFSGLKSLKIKETDRLSALRTELLKFGYVLTEHTDCSLSWDGSRCTPDPLPAVKTYEDHRMAMSFTPLSIKQLRGIRIMDTGVVTKSYPTFWADLRKAGFVIKEV